MTLQCFIGQGNSAQTRSLSEKDFGNASKARFSMGQHGQQLVLDVSVELGVSVPEVLEAYKLIVQQATCKKGKNRDKVKAIIFNRKRLMRKTFRSFIYYCYGLVSTKDMNPAEEVDFGANEVPCNIELQRENMHPNEIQDIIPGKQSK